MKISRTRKIKSLASALITTLVICSILSIFVLYYLSLIDQQSYLNARSQSWNMAIAVSEAGIEEGMQQLNNAYPDLNTDGWTYNGSSYYWKSNSLPDGNGYLSYIFITNTYNPCVVSRAFITMPPVYARAKAPMSFLATVGFTSPNGTAPVTRAVQVTCAKHSQFLVAMVAKKNIDLNGKGITTDSYDSSMPGVKSTINGQYDPTKAGDKGDIATNLGVIDSISGGNASIYGHAHTGPGSPSTALQIGPNGYVGSHADYSTVGSGNVDKGWWLPDSNFTFPDTSMPNYSTWTTPTNGTIVTSTTTVVTNSYVNSTIYPTPVPYSGIATNYYPTNWVTKSTIPIASVLYGCVPGTARPYGPYYQYWEIDGFTYTYNTYATNTTYTTNTYDHILWGNSSYTNYYQASDLSGSTIVLGPNVVLALPGGLNMSGHDQITVAAGANISVYSGGNSCTVGGNGVVNQSGFAANFLLYCAPTVTSFSFNGNGTFTGCVVAPNANVAMNGGGSTPQDYCGAIIANSVTMNGQFKFHYDEALAGGNKNGRFLITAWNEIK